MQSASFCLDLSVLAHCALRFGGDCTLCRRVHHLFGCWSEYFRDHHRLGRNLSNSDHQQILEYLKEVDNNLKYNNVTTF